MSELWGMVGGGEVPNSLLKLLLRTLYCAENIILVALTCELL